jgi:hypothetical protein
MGQARCKPADMAGAFTETDKVVSGRRLFRHRPAPSCFELWNIYPFALVLVEGGAIRYACARAFVSRPDQSQSPCRARHRPTVTLGVRPKRRTPRGRRKSARWYQFTTPWPPAATRAPWQAWRRSTRCSEPPSPHGAIGRAAS